jgi:hypothetical protein
LESIDISVNILFSSGLLFCDCHFCSFDLLRHHSLLVPIVAVDERLVL